LRKRIASIALGIALFNVLGVSCCEASSDPTAVVTNDAYRAKLQELRVLTAECAKARDETHCDPNLVGFDTHLALRPGPNAPTRLIRYDWLRVLFARAKQGNGQDEELRLGPAASGPSIADLMQAAQRRLDYDMAQAAAPDAALPRHDAEQKSLKQVLAGSEFKNLKRPDAKDTLLEKFGRWLNRLFDGVGSFRTHSAWVARVLVWGFVLSIVVGLAWALIQMERRWRVRLVPDADATAPDAPSARDWQLWMADARESAEAGAWREAIHFLYWASISRLESKRLWPADRARTPREYLALVRQDDARYGNLRTLTHLFERTWYGGRETGEAEFRSAERVAADLIAGTHSAQMLRKPAAQGGVL
jgi:hypothetical protein